jgi:regulatory protein
MPPPVSVSLKGRALRWLAQREHSREELARKLRRHLAAERRTQAQGGSWPGKQAPRGDPGPAEGATDPGATTNLTAAEDTGCDEGTGHGHTGRNNTRRGGTPRKNTVCDDILCAETGREDPGREDVLAEDQRRIDEALDALEAHGLLSDARAAHSLLVSRASRHGSRRLRQDMQARGLAPELIERTLASVADSEFDRARQLWQRRFGRAPQDLREHARQSRFLLGRGFAGDVVRRLLAQVRKAAAEDGPERWHEDAEGMPADPGADADADADTDHDVVSSLEPADESNDEASGRSPPRRSGWRAR